MTLSGVEGLKSRFLLLVRTGETEIFESDGV